MRALYDSEADALAIDLVEDPKATHGEEVHPRCVVAVTDDDQPVSVELLYPRLGIDEELAAAAERYGLDADELRAAARAAIAAPDRTVTVKVEQRPVTA